MWWRKNENWKVKSPFKVLPVNNTKKIKSKKKKKKEKKRNRLKKEAELFAAWNELINFGLGFRDAQHLIRKTHDGVPDSQRLHEKTGLMQNGCKVSDFAPYAETYQVIPLLGLLCYVTTYILR